MQEATIIPRPDIATGYATSDDGDALHGKSVEDFAGELEQALRHLKDAADEKNRVDESISALQKELENRGWWDALGATVSGKTDKELSSMVEGLGKSLGLTQNVVQVMLKVATQKNQVLRSFNAAIVDKITAIQGDTRTLDASQRKVALHFLGEIKHQIDEQLRHQELVDSHQDRLDIVDQWRAGKETSDAELVDSIEILSVKLERARDAAAALAEDVKRAHESIGVLTSDIAMLERERRRYRSLTARFSRYMPSLIALAIGTAALVVAIR